MEKSQLSALNNRIECRWTKQVAFLAASRAALLSFASAFFLPGAIFPDPGARNLPGYPASETTAAGVIVKLRRKLYAIAAKQKSRAFLATPR